MSDTVIKVENLSKLYRLGEVGTGTLRHDFNRWWHKVRGKEDPYLKIGETNDRATKGDSDYAWALKDVSFEVRRGEVLGIIGRNGAGKSTLLKILSRVTMPTTGEIKIKGRVASLLEVGTGFNPELTGRDNIYLNGAILGMRKRETDRKFDEIVDFSGVERYIDTPVKRYSSGMYVRLAFAVAAHLEPEILIVDEVLAVGDVQFQTKCLGKMKDVSKKDGRTVLFVSHNMQAVTSLCARAILLNAGKVENNGAVDEVITGYLASASESEATKREQVWNDIHTAPGNDNIRIQRISISSSESPEETLLDVGTPFVIAIDYWNLAPQHPLVLNLMFHTIEGSPVFETISISMRDANWLGHRVPAGLFRSICHIPGDLFNEGTFCMKLRYINAKAILYHNDRALEFTIHDMAKREIPWFGKYMGVVRPELKWETIPVSTRDQAGVTN